LIHPCFTFLVGVALPYSLVKRLSQGQTVREALRHAARRAFVLICLGIFLRSVGHEHTVFIFMDTLTLIGLGYLPLFLIGLAVFHDSARPSSRPTGAAWQRFRSGLPWITLGVILVGYWAAFVLYPLPAVDFDYAAVGVDDDWQHHFSGFAAHWNKNSNLGWAFDRWFLDLFPRSEPFAYHPGGYSTLNFVPTLGTMLLGLIAGRWLLENRDWQMTIKQLLVTSAACFLLALALDQAGVCPIVKRLWTPSWVLFSGGWSLLFLAAFHLTVDIAGWRTWTFPLQVLGMNAMAAYCLADLIPPFILSSLQTHLGQNAFAIFGTAYEPLLSGLAVLAVFWLILFWMHRRRIFLKI
jgi:predicted acyltransferase